MPWLKFDLLLMKIRLRLDLFHQLSHPYVIDVSCWWVFETNSIDDVDINLPATFCSNHTAPAFRLRCFKAKGMPDEMFLRSR